MKTTRQHFNLMQAMAALIVSCLGILTAAATDGAWTGAADANWETVGNWTASPVPGTGDTATFNGAGNANTTVSLGGGVTLLNLLFDTSAAAAYTIGSGAVGGETLTLDHGAAITVNSTVANAQIFNSAITLGPDKNTGSYTLQNDSAQTLTLAGDITGSALGATAGQKTLVIDGAGDIVISGNVAKGSASLLKLTKTGAGTLSLTGQTALQSAASGVTALTLASDGLINLGVGGQLTITGTASPMPNGISGSGTITGGSISLANSISSTGMLTIHSQLTGIGGAFGGNAGNTVVLSNPNNSFSQNIAINTVTLVANDLACLGSGSTIKLGNANYGTGHIVFKGAGGTLTKSIGPGLSNNTWSMDQSGTGTLKITGDSQTGSGTAGGLTMKGSTSGTAEFAGILSVTHPVNKSGSGTWILSGANTYANTTTLNGGTLTLNYDTGAGGTDSSKLSDTAALKLNGGTLELSGGTHPEVVLSTTLDMGTSFIKQTGGGSATLALGPITFTAGALDVGGTGIATTASGNLAAGILSLRATLAESDYAMNDGANNIVAYPGGSYTTFAGTLAANTIYSLAGNGSVGVNQNQASSGLKITTTGSGQSLALANNISLDVGSILFAGAHDYSITTLGTGKIAPSVLLNYGSGVLTLGSFDITFYQYGTGKTVLSAAAAGNNDFYVYGGTVQFSDKFQLGTETDQEAVWLNNGTLVADTAAGDITMENGSYKRTFSIGEGGGTIDVIGGNSLTVSGVMSGAGRVVFGSASSNGKMLLTAANTYTGPTLVNGGTVLINNATAAASDVTVNNGGTLGGTGTVGGTVNVLASGSLAPGGADGLGTLTCGSTTLAAGSTLRVRVAGDTAGQFGVLNVGNGTLDLGGADLTVNDAGYSGTGPLTIATANRTGAITGTFGTITGTRKIWKATVVDGKSVVLNGFPAVTIITVR